MGCCRQGSFKDGAAAAGGGRGCCGRLAHGLVCMPCRCSSEAVLKDLGVRLPAWAYARFTEAGWAPCLWVCSPAQVLFDACDVCLLPYA